MKVVMFHNILSEPLDQFDRELSRTPASRFRRTIRYCKDHYDILPFSQALEQRKAGDESKALTITFDDGFAGVFDTARPILAELGLTGTVFILTEQSGPIPTDRLLHFEWLEIAFRLTSADSLYIPDLGINHCDLSSISARVRELIRIKRVLKLQPTPVREAVQAHIMNALGVSETAIRAFAADNPRYRKLSADQIRTLLAEGWTIGGHTRTHPTLSKLDGEALLEEITGNARDLEAAFGLHHIPFAYPYGEFDHINQLAEQTVREAGFGCAFTAIPGVNTADTNPFRLLRFSEKRLLAHNFTTPSSTTSAGAEVAV